MLFNSPEFIFFFLPAVLAVFLIAQRLSPECGLRVVWLTLSSLVFYSWFDWHFTFLLGGSIIFNFLCGQRLRQRAPALLAIGIAANLALLGWFKYVGMLSGLATFIPGLGSLSATALPLAISFFTFTQIAYLVDISRGQQPESNIWRYSLFVTFFPHVIAGPITRHWELIPQFRNSTLFRFNAENFAVGITIFVIGLVKKVILSASMQNYADRVFDWASSGTSITLIPAWCGVLTFSFQIYFDFSGYTDMAVGLARMFGIVLPENFSAPYKATSIIEFWRRWHITLSRFLRDYLYIPLGGNRHGEIRRYTNLIVVMLLGGLWHGASWLFILWGGLHGVFLALNHGWLALKERFNWQSTRLGLWASWLLTMICVVFAWAAFRSRSWVSVETLWKGMLGLSGITLPESYLERLGPVGMWLTALGIRFAPGSDVFLYPTRSDLAVLVGLIAITTLLPTTQDWMARTNPVLRSVPQVATVPDRLAWRPSALCGAATAVIAFVVILLVYQNHENVFIYFQF